LTPSGYVDWYETVPTTPADGPYGGELGWRVDEGHWEQQGPYLAPHATFPPSPGYVDPVFVSPPNASDPLASADAVAWSAGSSGASGNTLQPAWATAAVPAAPVMIPAPPDRRLVASRAELAPPSPAPVAEPPAARDPETTPAAVRPAAAAPQRALTLPSIFSTADSEAEAQPAFAPDWEVDRLAWPTVCERLLETEDRYFRSVGQRLKEATQDSHHVVMITGARRGEGRTTLALCLARCAAQAGVSVAVVDADLENPQLGNQLGMETPCSWLEVVAGKSPLNEAAVSSLEDGLTLFPLTGSEDLEAIAGDAQLTGVLRTIAAHFPLVIIDTGPLGSDDRHPFATGEDCPIDTAIVVRDLRNTTEKKALATAELLQRSGVPAVGIAENFRDTEVP
jgi:Mrp family chromosome partitioning ATPase